MNTQTRKTSARIGSGAQFLSTLAIVALAGFASYGISHGGADAGLRGEQVAAFPGTLAMTVDTSVPAADTVTLVAEDLPPTF